MKGARRCARRLFAPFRVFRELIQDIRGLLKDLRQAQLFLDGLAKLVRDRIERRRTGVEPGDERSDGPSR